MYLLHAFCKRDRCDTDKNLACAEKALARFMSERNVAYCCLIIEYLKESITELNVVLF